jgi:ribosomal-protein-serine acetyltransferase
VVSLRVNDAIELRECAMHHAAEWFGLIQANRRHLRAWMPWLDDTMRIDQLERYIRDCRKKADEDNARTYLIRVEGRIVGSIGENAIDWRNRRIEFGYWIDARHQGRGIVTQSVARLVRRAFEDLRMNRVSILCAVENTRSRAVPERMGFTLEGVMREAEWLYDRYVDLAVYSLLAQVKQPR